MTDEESASKSSPPAATNADSDAPAFESWRSFWAFRNEVARQRRYIRSATTERFLAAVAATAEARVTEIPKGWIGWRAAVAHGWRHEPQIDDEIPCAAPSDRMIPWADRAHEGRVNPKGIPCLYLATERDTAMSEVRPWVGSLVSVARFQTKRALRVVDCSREHKSSILHFEEPAAIGRVRPVWADIDHAFSEPTARSDDIADYAPTQILAELFREQGYDGVVYKSVFGEDGYNVALFDLQAAVMRTCGLFKVESASYRFWEADNEYFLRTAEEDGPPPFSRVPEIVGPAPVSRRKTDRPQGRPRSPFESLFSPSRFERASESLQGERTSAPRARVAHMVLSYGSLTWFWRKFSAGHHGGGLPVTWRQTAGHSARQGVLDSLFLVARRPIDRQSTSGHQPSSRRR